MNKKIIILTIVCTILVILITGFILFNNRVVSKITIDINPSIEIGLNKDNKVVKAKALNKDAKDIVADVKGKNLDDALDTVTNNVIEKGYVKEKEVTLLINSSGNINNNEIKNMIEKDFTEKQINPEVIVIENISKEDIKTAKKYDITPAKASYINSINNANVEVLTDKTVEELKETKETGYYCDKGYNLEGGNCVKEIQREKALNGDRCPSSYGDYDGTCYAEATPIITDRLICGDDFTLKDGKCIRTEILNAEVEYSCEI